MSNFMSFIGGGSDKAQDFRGSLRLFVRALRPERTLMALTVLLTAGSVLATVVGPVILGRAIDLVVDGVIGKPLPAGLSKEQVVAQTRADGNGALADMLSGMDIDPGRGVDFDALGRLLVIIALIYLGAWVLGALASRTTAAVAQRSMLRIRAQAEAKLARLPLSYFDSQPRGEVLSKVTNDIDNLGHTLQQTLGQLLSAVLTIVGVLIAMLWASWLLALVALVTVPVSVVVAKRIAKRAMPQYGMQWATTGQLNGHIEEVYAGHELVKLFGWQGQASAVFQYHNRTLTRASFKAQFVSGLIQPAMTFLGNLNYVLVVVVGGLRVASGTMSIGDVQAFLQYSRRFSQSLTDLASIANLLQSGAASFERVSGFLEAPEETPDPRDPAEPAQVRGRVSFEHVSFRYQADSPLIEDLSLAVEPGQTVAIVGPTGAGKTTLVNLLMRFYDVTGGRITVDGVDTAAMARERVRGLTGMVLQDAWLFGGTIAENIAYGAGDVSRERIVAAARATHVDHFVRTLPDGYDTVIDEEGTNVSAGEKQLITIARAFLAEPSILILDEATSSVDTRTELLIQRATAELRRGRTSFVIAHRLSTIREADLILVMEDGRIVEQGTHEHLRVAGGAYQRLYEAQFSQAAV
ncbi:ABC transporter ATP-binding protein [Kitasatospora sp. NPDC048239]|uniref:ABC transporter ATP-binding protein n=1 Tax=Kitasatospora sp. NPDC048239 TaxID=3364046 RepID=UPI0037176FB6